MITSQGAKASTSPVEGLSSLLTPSQVSRFVQKSIEELKLGQVSLTLSLENQQWQASAKQAHKLKSTICLFSANSLVEALDLIESDSEEIRMSDFKQSLIFQFEELINSLESYLSND